MEPLFPVRQQKRLCTDQTKIDLCLTETATGFLGLCANDVPYVIPLNYAWLNGAIYFHGATEGRKNRIIDRNPQACFTVCEHRGTLVAPIPAHIDTSYISVIAEGPLSFVQSLPERTEALQAMLDKYVPGYFDSPLAQTHVEKYVSSLGSKTGVWKLTPIVVTAKENDAPQERLFYEGRTRGMDA